MEDYKTILEYYIDNVPNPDWEGFSKFVFNSQQQKIEDLKYRTLELEATIAGKLPEFLKGEQ